MTMERQMETCIPRSRDHVCEVPFDFRDTASRWRYAFLGLRIYLERMMRDEYLQGIPCRVCCHCLPEGTYPCPKCIEVSLVDDSSVEHCDRVVLGQFEIVPAQTHPVGRALPRKHAGGRGPSSGVTILLSEV